MSSAVVAMLAAQQAARARVVNTFERAGATTPETARPLGQLGEMDEVMLRTCVEQGLVREGAAGTFYVSLHSLTPPRQRWTGGRRLVMLLAFWLIVIVIPIVFVFFANR